MQKKIRRPVSSLDESSIISPESGRISGTERVSGPLGGTAISNDNSRQGAPSLSSHSGSGVASVRPKVYMSPKKAAARNQVAAKKPVRFSTEFSAQKDALAADKMGSRTSMPTEKPSPALLSADAEPVANDIHAGNGTLPLASNVPSKTGLFFDLKFAVGLIAIVVAVNLLLAMLVEKAEDKKPAFVASAPAKPVAPASVAKVATPKAEPAQGAVVTNSAPEGMLADVAPAAGTPHAFQQPVIAQPPAATVKPVPAPHPPSLGVVTSAADEKQPKRNLLSIIDQY